MASSIMIENVEDKNRADLIQSLTGPFRTMGTKIKPDEINAPAWWHGEEEAYADTMTAMAQLPQRGRGR